MPKVQLNSLTLGGGEERAIFQKGMLGSNNFGSGFGSNDSNFPSLGAFSDAAKSLTDMSKSAMNALSNASSQVASAIGIASALPTTALNANSGLFGSANSAAGTYDALSSGTLSGLNSAKSSLDSASGLLAPVLGTAAVVGVNTHANNLLSGDSVSALTGALGYLSKAALTLAKVSGNLPKTNHNLSIGQSSYGSSGTISSNLANQVSSAMGSVSSATGNVSALSNKLSNLTKASGLC